MMYQLRDLRVRHLDRQDEMLETWTMETFRTEAERRPWREASCYLPTLELELQSMAERAVRRLSGTYGLPNDLNDAARALEALFNDFELIAEEVVA